jgi:hypothetical protein
MFAEFMQIIQARRLWAYHGYSIGLAARQIPSTSLPKQHDLPLLLAVDHHSVGLPSIGSDNEKDVGHCEAPGPADASTERE